MHVKVPASAGPTITITYANGTVVNHTVSKDNRVAVKTQDEADHLLAVIEGSSLLPEEK